MTASFLQCAKIRLAIVLVGLKRILNEWKLYNGEAAMITTNEAIDRSLLKHTYQTVTDIYTNVRYLTGTSMSLETFARMFRTWRSNNPHDEKSFRTAQGHGTYKKFKHKES